MEAPAPPQRAGDGVFFGAAYPRPGRHGRRRDEIRSERRQDVEASVAQKITPSQRLSPAKATTPLQPSHIHNAPQKLPPSALFPLTCSMNRRAQNTWGPVKYRFLRPNHAGDIFLQVKSLPAWSFQRLTRGGHLPPPRSPPRKPFYSLHASPFSNPRPRQLPTSRFGAAASPTGKS